MATGTSVSQPSHVPTPRMEKLLIDVYNFIESIMSEKNQPRGFSKTMELDEWEKYLDGHFELVNSRTITQAQRAKYFDTIMTIFQYGGNTHKRWAMPHCWAIFTLFARFITPGELCNLDFDKDEYAQWWEFNFPNEAKAKDVSLYMHALANAIEINERFRLFYELRGIYQVDFKPSTPEEEFWPPQEFGDFRESYQKRIEKRQNNPQGYVAMATGAEIKGYQIRFLNMFECDEW